MLPTRRRVARATQWQSPELSVIGIGESVASRHPRFQVSEPRSPRAACMSESSCVQAKALLLAVPTDPSLPSQNLHGRE